ncbi:MAG: Crp/Fnr family transcriptional regulator [Nostoc sp.]|uniref:Crp/Fnr family transcriptional regulator n=1 Tax=Nostoc sp. TaxID=1180 RepID=UPI002FFC1BC1
MLSPLVTTVSIFQKQPDPEFFSAGQVIFEEGQPGDHMYGILEGEVDILVNSKIIETIETGEVFDVGVLVGVKNRTYTAIAKVDSKLVSLDEERFLFAVQETPMFAVEVMKSYSKRVSRLQHMV